MIIQILLLALGFLMLVKGADWFVEGASRIAGLLGIPQLVIGLTIVAMGTSAPEAAVSITAALKGNSGITIGNIVGSNILNVLIILGITGVITMVPIQMTTLKYEMPYMLFVTMVLFAMGSNDAKITRFEGGLLWVLFLIYLAYLFVLAKKGNKKPDVSREEKSVIKLLGLLVLGGVTVVLGSNFAVDSATEIARILGMSERFIGLTIIALGTSLPELVTSVTAAIKGKSDIAIGNIVGSNIFNILFVVGTAALITPIDFEKNFLMDTIIAGAVCILLFISVIKNKCLGRKSGIVMLLGYCAYFVYLIM